MRMKNIFTSLCLGAYSGVLYFLSLAVPIVVVHWHILLCYVCKVPLKDGPLLYESEAESYEAGSHVIRILFWSVLFLLWRADM